MRVEFEVGDDAHAVAGAFEGEEEVWVAGVDFEDGAIGSDEGEGLDGIAGEAILVCPPGESSSESEASDSWAWYTASVDGDACAVERLVDFGEDLQSN